MKKLSLGALALSAVLAACQPNPTPVIISEPEVVTAPGEPVAGQAVNVNQALDQGAQVLGAMLSPSNADLDPDFREVLTGLGVGNLGSLSVQGLSLNPLALGRALTAQLGAQAIAVNPLALLPTGTWTVRAGVSTQTSTQPADGYVLIDSDQGRRLTAEWRVGGAATVTVTLPPQMRPDGTVYTPSAEVPTSARVVLEKGNKRLARAEMSLAPGACLNLVGPDALKLTVWAGKEASPALKASLDYAWTASGVKLSASGKYNTSKQKSEADISLDLRGGVSNRCDPASFSFTPTRLDLKADVDVPGHRADLDLKARDLKNLVFGAAALKVANPFATVSGLVAGSADYNKQRVLSLYGDLKDGADLDLIPGDGVRVTYLAEGAVVRTTLQAVFSKLFQAPVVMPMSLR